MTLKPIAVSMGDPAGVGLEVAARAFHEHASDLPEFYLIADADALGRAARRAQISLAVRILDRPEDAVPGRGLCVLHRPLADVEKPGLPDPANAKSITTSLAEAVAHQKLGAASALVTLPIAKASLYQAGFGYPGQTEYLAALTADWETLGARGPVMMLVAAGLKVALATIHMPLSDVPQHLSVERIVQVARVTAEALRRDFGIANPRLVFAGLNPHAGESGSIGREEIEIINPAAALLREEGWNVSDALPADTLFHEAARSTYDAALAMYHDQGLIPIKTLDFWGGVNVSLGLPIVRTSPDHGTAFDIAGRGRARADSFIAALRLAEGIARSRARTALG
ncbi:MAG: 4-hydroxythreonine-4-phosphate dehydrogenase PdxA [Caulobacterales bacterium]